MADPITGGLSGYPLLLVGRRHVQRTRRCRFQPAWRSWLVDEDSIKNPGHMWSAPHRRRSLGHGTEIIDEMGHIMTLALSTALHTSFADAVSRTRDALADNGFGVLTEIDMQATLKAKLGQDMEDYIILGACNPPLAHRAVTIDRQIGLLLPCNVVVRADPSDDTRVLVEALNPQVLVQVTGEPALREVADDVTTKLQAAIDALASASTRGQSR